MDRQPQSTVESINPYSDDQAKHVQIERMFDSIAPAYDTMNRLMTMGIDRLWRRRTVKAVARHAPHHILDVATGTGDLAIALARRNPGATVAGVDLSRGMIDIGIAKVAKAALDNRVTLKVADALKLPFDDNTFDAVTVAYGVRNFEHLHEGYCEMTRVLKPGGHLYVLELTPPASPIIKPLYNLYTRKIIPAVGRLISKDADAYTYLPESIRAVPARGDMTALMTRAGLVNATFRSMTMGVCTLYIAEKDKPHQHIKNVNNSQKLADRYL